MKKTILCTTLLCFLSLSVLFSQYEERPSAISFRATQSNFQLPLHNFENWDINDYTPGAEISYSRFWKKNMNIVFPLKIAKADLPIDETTVDKDNVIMSLDGLIQWRGFSPTSAVYPHIFVGIGGMYEPGNNQFNLEIPVGIGLNFRLSKHFYLTLQSQYRYNNTPNRNQLQHGLGFTTMLKKKKEQEPPIVDTDLDGVPDAEDQCPTEVGTEATFGCPDNDGDGIANKMDACPEEAGTVPLDGCPDNDGDGIANKNDACPDIAGTVELKGCPDGDADGFSDEEDECPDVAGTVSGCPDSDGDGVKDSEDPCPDTSGTLNGCPDSDGDGVSDADDKCPTTSGEGTETGCPEIKEEDKEILTFAMQAIQFETGRATLKPASNNVLDQIVDILNRYPDYKCTVSGHTDSIGSAETNQFLSQNRAKTCYDYLISKGIAKDRLSFVGHGESKPIADNKYKDGREENRRVEFDIYFE